jgi:Flp pilus assembly protein TadD
VTSPPPSEASARASRAWPDPDPRRPSWPAVFLISACCFPIEALADTIRLRGGRIVEAESCVRHREELQCRRAGGTFSIPLDLVESVEKRSASHKLTRKSRPPAGSAGMPVEQEPAQPPGEGLLSRAEAEARLEHLVRPGAGMGDPERREAAMLHTYIAGLAVQGGEMDEADRHYQEARRLAPALLLAHLNHATLLINRRRLDDARAVLREVLADQPTSARALYLLGEAALQEDRYEEAIDLWRRSLELKPDPQVSERLERARRLLEAERDFQTSEAGRFSLKFDGDQASPSLATEILEFLEQSHTDLTARLAHEPQTPIRVTLYSRESFLRATDSPDWVGGLFDGELRIPIGGLTRLNSAVRRVLIHELAHCFVASRSGGRAPDWVQEGFAQVMEGLNGRKDRERLARSCATLGPEGCPAQFPYPAALSRVEFLLGRWSQGHFNNLLDHLARGNDIDSALREATGLAQSEFLAAWADWLARDPA